MELFQHQRDLIAQSPLKHGLWWECGTGKTLTTIKLAEKNANTVLIVCPKSLKENWAREIEKWVEYPHKGARNVGAYEVSNWIKQLHEHFKIVSKEEFRRDWEDLSLAKYEGLIIDEAHFFSGHKSQMFKTAQKYIKAVQPKCIYLATATPFLSSPFNIYCYEVLLGYKAKWQDYRRKYFNEIRMGNRIIPQVKKDAKYALAKTLNKIGSTVKKEDCLDLPDQVYLREDFKLNSDQRKHIRLLESSPLVTSHIVLYTKRHQIAGGTLRMPEASKSDPALVFKSEKLTRVLELAEEHPKLIIVCRYNAELDLIASKLKKPYVLLNGSVPGDERQKRLDYANSQDEMVFLVNAACSEGWNAISFNTLVFYSNGFSYKDRVQMEGRIHRIGQINRCTYIDLVMTDDIDEDILRSLKNKQDFDLARYATQHQST